MSGVNTQAKAKRAATLAANIAYENSSTNDKVNINNIVLQNAADAAIKNFNDMLSSEIAKDPTAARETDPMQGV